MLSKHLLKKFLQTVLIISVLSMPQSSHADLIDLAIPINNKAETSITAIMAGGIVFCVAVSYGLHKLYSWYKTSALKELHKTVKIREYDSNLDKQKFATLLRHSYFEDKLTPKEMKETISQIQNEISNNKNITYVLYNTVEGQDALCAFCIAKKTGWIELVIVDPSYYRKGYGEMLVRYGIKKLRDEHHCTEIALGALDERAEKLYEKIGFTRTKKYYCKAMPIMKLPQAALAII